MKKRKVLFLCTGNSCRSQMAEGFGRKYGQNRWEVYSAGTDPKGIHPLAIEVMGEKGIDISHHTSDYMHIGEMEEMDLVVTLCGDAKDSCPLTPGKVERIHWVLEDPAKATGSLEEKKVFFQIICDKIQEKVKELIQDRSD